MIKQPGGVNLNGDTMSAPSCSAPCDFHMKTIPCVLQIAADEIDAVRKMFNVEVIHIQQGKRQLVDELIDTTIESHVHPR